jgi:hypothetical protein
MSLVQACSINNAVRETYEKFSLDASNMKFSTQDEEQFSIGIIICILLSVYLSIIRMQ